MKSNYGALNVPFSYYGVPMFSCGYTVQFHIYKALKLHVGHCWLHVIRVSSLQELSTG